MTVRAPLVRRRFSGGGRVLGTLALTCFVALTGCARGCTSSRPPIHINPSMDDQPKVLAQTASDFFYDGSSMRQPVPGTVALDGLKEDAPFYTGKGPDGQSVAKIPVTVNEALVERGQPAIHDLLPAVPRRKRRRQGDPLPAGQRSHRLVPPGQDPELPGRADFRRDHERVGADAAVPLADPSGGPLGDHRLRARARAQAAGEHHERACGDQMREARDEVRDEPQAARASLGPILVLVMFGGVAKMSRPDDHEYRDPVPGSGAAVDADAPRARTGRTRRPTRRRRRRRSPTQEAEYRTFPVVGSRVAIWVVAQLHLLFAAFVLAVPIFAFIIEAIGYKTGDSAVRPARARVHAAPLGVVLAHRDLRRVPHVHAHHPVPEVHELPDERVLPDVPAVRPAVLRGSLLPLHLLLRLGKVPSAGAPRPGARPQSRRHGAS